MKCTWSIPYEELNYGAKIIIYGAGKVGRRVAWNILNNKRCELVAIVDENYKELNEWKIFKNIDVISPDSIREICFDYIFIALESESLASDIREKFINMGIKEERIFWRWERGKKLYKNAINEYTKFLERNTEVKDRQFWLFTLPEHGNMGDYAIGYAEIDFMKHYFKDASIRTVTTNEWRKAKNEIINLVGEKDVVLLNGGGYIGDLWLEDNNYKTILEAFPMHKKIFFPNTLTYVDNSDKYEPFIKEMEWFSKQKNLLVFFREQRSYKKFGMYNSNCEFSPDMVLYTHTAKSNYQNSEKVLLCLRQDREKVFENAELMKRVLTQNLINYDELAINMGRFVSQQEGKILLNNICRKMQQYKCVITDRLHGMLISVISDVPCIAFDNKTNKVSGVYHWIEDQGYAYLASTEDINRIADIIEYIVNEKKRVGTYKPLTYEYERMAKIIDDFIWEKI